MTKISNRRLVDSKDNPDFYPTPEWGTEALLKYEKFRGNILEPCCGDGAMSEVLKQHGYDVISSDLYDRGYGEQKDFFSYEGNCTYENIITNPPYNIAEDILEHSLKLAHRKVAILVRTAFLESIGRYNRFYKQWPPKTVYVFTERLSMYPKGYEVKSGGTTSYSWMVWDKDCDREDTEIRWIAPGLKPRKTKRISV